MTRTNSPNENYFPWEKHRNFDDHDDHVVNSLISELNSANYTMAMKDEKIRHLSVLAYRCQETTKQMQRQIDVCVGTLARLKTADNMEEIAALLKSYEIEEHLIPFVN